MNFNPSISLYQGILPNTIATHSLDEIFQFIKADKYKDIVEEIRRHKGNKTTQDTLKRKLQGVTWSGTFKKRNSKGLTSYSYIICHDIDNLDADSVVTLKRALSLDPYVFCVFISPRGNGLKVLFVLEQGNHPVEHVSNYHEAAWLAIGNYLSKLYNIEVDEKCKDICRLCFVSYDPEIYVSDSYAIFGNDLIHKYTWTTTEKKQPAKKQQGKTPVADELAKLIAKCHEITQKTVTASSGSYNKYINVFALQANRYKIDLQDCLYEMLYYCRDHDQKDTEAVVKSVYKNFAQEHGKWLQDGKPLPELKKQKAVQAQIFKSELPQVDDSIKFWYEVEKVNAKGEVKGVDYKFSYNSGIKFLANNGFFKYRLDDENYQFIRIDQENKIVDIVTDLRIKEFYFDYLTAHEDEAEYWQVLEMMRRGVKNYCSTAVLEGLPYAAPDITRDDADRAHIYFKNCFVEINNEGRVIKQYSQQEGYIWKKQIISADFTATDEMSVFEKYLQYAITGRKCEAVELTELEQKKIDSTRSSIGYMIHQYKNPARAKAVISVDKKIRHHGEANGGAGKSLLGKGLARMINQCYIDGKNFKFDYDFAFQNVKTDTHFINFNDVPKNFQFERLFGMITEEFTYNKKKMDGIVIPFSLAPKFYISTNYSMKGDGGSNNRRQQLVEFSDYFNENNTVQQEFGHMFFESWDDAEWCRFYSYMIGCVELYMSKGLIEFPLENYGINKLLDTAGEEFVEYMEEQVTVLRSMGSRIDLGELYKKYIEANKHHDKTKRNTFAKWLRMWADVNNMLVNAHKPDGRDRSNGTDYVTFTQMDDDNKLPF